MNHPITLRHILLVLLVLAACYTGIAAYILALFDRTGESAAPYAAGFCASVAGAALLWFFG